MCSSSQDSKKTGARRFGTFVLKWFIGKNAVRLDLPAYFKIHRIIYVICKTPHLEQTNEISAPIPPVYEPRHLLPTGTEQEFEAVLDHKKVGRRNNFLVSHYVVTHVMTQNGNQRGTL